LLRSLPPAVCGLFLEMPNIKQQKKRVRTASQERLENLRFRSTAKTLARRLQAAVTEGDKARVTEEHKRLVSWLDRAAARGAIHKNTAARRKSQADRLASGPRA
jgi:small subunit ribosomal protein S20